MPAPTLCTKDFTPQFSFPRGQWMCSSAACVICFIVSDSFGRDRAKDALARTIGVNQLNYIMEVAERIYCDTAATLRNDHKMLMTHEVVQYLAGDAGAGRPWRFEPAVDTEEVGGLIGGLKEGGLELPSLQRLIEALVPGQAVAMTVRGHSTAFGCDADRQLRTYWSFDSGEGKFLTFGGDVRGLVLHTVGLMRPGEEWSGTLFTSQRSRAAGGSGRVRET